MRKLFKYYPQSSEVFLEQLLVSSKQDIHFTLLYSGGNISNRTVSNRYEWIASMGALAVISPTDKFFETLKEFYKKNNDWLFGCLSYDLKNEIETLNSKNDDNLMFPELHFVQPEVVFINRDNAIECHHYESFDIQSKLEAIERIEIPNSHSKVKFQSKISRDEYLNAITELLKNIKYGNIYEINYCQEFYSSPNNFDPQVTYLKMLKKFPTPFSCFVKQNSRYILSASPERFLKKQGNKLTSQPIKGTIRRSDDQKEDMQLANELLTSDKERSENIMIVDLVRNDLAKIAKKGTVKVEELCGIYSYQTVHQMISSVSAQLNDKCHPVDAVKSCFPMGSMTGAPKVKAMQLIEEFEHTKRGIYSGAVGYFSPNGDFDFNIIIRTLLYSETNNYLSLMAGSAITSLSIPENEYEECLLKANSFFELIGKSKDRTNA